MLKTTEQLEQSKAGEQPAESFVPQQTGNGAGSIRKTGAHSQPKVASDTVANELMIRRIIAALTNAE